MAVGYAKEDRNASIPHFKNLAEWEAVKSTKIDVTAQIVKHTLSSDRAPPVTFLNGSAIFPEVPPLTKGETPSKKVVIYQDFASLASVLRNVSCSFVFGIFA